MQIIIVTNMGTSAKTAVIFTLFTQYVNEQHYNLITWLMVTASSSQDKMVQDTNDMHVKTCIVMSQAV